MKEKQSRQAPARKSDAENVVINPKPLCGSWLAVAKKKQIIKGD